MGTDTSVRHTVPPPTLADFRREILRLHGCAATFERFVTVSEAAGRARRVVAVFALDGHPAGLCYAWPELGTGIWGYSLVAVLQAEEVTGPEAAITHVAAAEHTSRERWLQEYA